MIKYVNYTISFSGSQLSYIIAHGVLCERGALVALGEGASGTPPLVANIDFGKVGEVVDST